MWRTGRKVKLHLYRQLGPNPADSDPPIGTMFTPEDAATAVRAVNGETQPLIGEYGGPLIEMYRVWTDPQGHQHVALYMPQPDDRPVLRHYVEMRTEGDSR